MEGRKGECPSKFSQTDPSLGNIEKALIELAD
jgi:hypothetical protein